MTGVNRGAPILALIDLEHPDAAETLARTAVAEAGTAPLHLCYVLPYGNYSYVGAFIPQETVKQAGQRAHDAMDALVDRLGAPTPPTIHILRGGVGEQAVMLAESIHAGLIMLNAKRPDAQAHGLGPHAAQIMRHAHCSVVVIR